MPVPHSSVSEESCSRLLSLELGTTVRACGGAGGGAGGHAASLPVQTRRTEVLCLGGPGWEGQHCGWGQRVV